eukprot:1486105-Amphidinium_carterae.2
MHYILVSQEPSCPSIHGDDDADNDEQLSEDTLPLGGSALHETRAEHPAPSRTAWGEMTLHAMAEHLEGKRQSRALRMATACSGTGAPSFAAEVYNVERIGLGVTKNLVSFML